MFAPPSPTARSDPLSTHRFQFPSVRETWPAPCPIQRPRHRREPDPLAHPAHAGIRPSPFEVSHDD
jgi:hypothetical protein